MINSGYKKSIYIPLYFFIGMSLCFSSCQRKESIKRTPTKETKALEEEIQYFFIGAGYDVYIEKLDDIIYDGYDSYQEYLEMVNSANEIYPIDYIDVDNIRYMHPIDSQGNLVNITEILEPLETEDGLFLKPKKDITGYKLMKEVYRHGDNNFKAYCKDTKLKNLGENLIFDHTLFMRLYNRNNQVLSENQMRTDIDHDLSYLPSFSMKIKPLGTTEVKLVGALKLPPKEQRGGLKYQTVRLDSNGNPKPFLWDLQKNNKYYYTGVPRRPYQYYLYESELEPYSEYKNWPYSKKTGCYIFTYRRSIGLQLP